MGHYWFPHLNREQRLSYQLIHSSVDSLNAKNDRLARWIEDIWPPKQTAEKTLDGSATLEQWGEQVKVLYRLAASSRWHIRYHLENPNIPSMDIMGSMHEEYLKDQERITGAINDIMEKAKNLERQDFEKIYDPSSFE